MKYLLLVVLFITGCGAGPLESELIDNLTEEINRLKYENTILKFKNECIFHADSKTVLLVKLDQFNDLDVYEYKVVYSVQGQEFMTLTRTKIKPQSWNMIIKCPKSVSEIKNRR